MFGLLGSSSSSSISNKRYFLNTFVDRFYFIRCYNNQPTSSTTASTSSVSTSTPTSTSTSKSRYRPPKNGQYKLKSNRRDILNSKSTNNNSNNNNNAKEDIQKQLQHIQFIQQLQLGQTNNSQSQDKKNDPIVQLAEDTITTRLYQEDTLKLISNYSLTHSPLLDFFVSQLKLQYQDDLNEIKKQQQPSQQQQSEQQTEQQQQQQQQQPITLTFSNRRENLYKILEIIMTQLKPAAKKELLLRLPNNYRLELLSRWILSIPRENRTTSLSNLILLQLFHDARDGTKQIDVDRIQPLPPESPCQLGCRQPLAFAPPAERHRRHHPNPSDSRLLQAGTAHRITPAIPKQRRSTLQRNPGTL
ncbi:hypothetical protein PPL_12318 [Heterostelium album PN500]|uniref:Uncharacterized protein n=1 Tax=Heterostelium pallidum (strain ATCC 26659 / Pp 5 / PN500) TaxID=670386 RepID=D3BMA8_HETP5|nr:hypothetical protein PPL_12318 [Heterostelium album PN500]EFA77709.1 hypothetical protein PPL_12318 [Heterostelium album PN500]|eukprot:XP_020429837.1 hypothetical protein PPL_12318 [Heterostelium album PN500]